MQSSIAKTITRSGVSIYTEHFGSLENPVILLMAGATVSMLYWDEAFCDKLASNGFFVIRYDNRDVGMSSTGEPGTISYDITDLVDDAIHILDGYEIEKAHFMGISLGGLIAQIAAIRYPERINSLVLMSTGPWGTPDENIPPMDTDVIDFHTRGGNVNWDDEKEVVDYMLQAARIMAGHKPVDYGKEKQRVKAEFHRAINYRSMFNHAMLQGGEIYYDRLNEISHPALIIHGTEDKIWHFNHTRKLLSEIKNSRLLTLQDTGHEVNENDWDIIIRAVTEFIGSHP